MYSCIQLDKNYSLTYLCHFLKQAFFLLKQFITRVGYPFLSQLMVHGQQCGLPLNGVPAHQDHKLLIQKIDTTSCLQYLCVGIGDSKMWWYIIRIMCLSMDSPYTPSGIGWALQGGGSWPEINAPWWSIWHVI